ncbi:MAG: hypothetical protein OEU56_22980 [Rhodospirillales bacterium]|nr:hypothetical protein [Rhodospirillales bacterium]
MNTADSKAGVAPAAPSERAAPLAARLSALALKAGVFVAALLVSVLVTPLVYALLGVPLQPGEMGLASAGWVTALVVLMTIRPRSSRHWLLVAAGIGGLIVAASLGAAAGDLALHRELVPDAGAVVGTMARVVVLLAFWGPVMVVFAKQLYRAGLVVESWETRPAEDASG